MKLTKDQVRHVAKLANIPLETGDEERYSSQLSKVLEHIDKLNQIDTLSIIPVYNASLNTNITRPDEVGTSLTQDEALMNASDHKNGYIATKGVRTK